MGQLKYLVIHCTDTPAGREVTAKEIKQWHTAAPPVGRGWKQVGYHLLFHLDGRVEELVANNGDNTVDPWEITNGVEGFNSVAEHIVYAGGMGKDTRTPEQKTALANYVKDFKKKHPSVEIVGHHDLNPGKACPNFDVKAWLKTIL